MSFESLRGVGRGYEDKEDDSETELHNLMLRAEKLIDADDKQGAKQLYEVIRYRIGEVEERGLVSDKALTSLANRYYQLGWRLFPDAP